MSSDRNETWPRNDDEKRFDCTGCVCLVQEDGRIENLDKDLVLPARAGIAAHDTNARRCSTLDGRRACQKCTQTIRLQILCNMANSRLSTSAISLYEYPTYLAG